MNWSALLLVGVFASSVNAATVATSDEKFYEISSVEVSEVQDESFAPLHLAPAPRLDCQPTAPAVLRDGINFNEVIKMGEALWQIVAANKPVVSIQTPLVHVLPAGAECWMDLQGWEGPKVAKYDVVYKNMYGMKVINTSFRVVYYAKGNFDGRGSFISNATVLAGQVDVMWGFNFAAAVESGSVMNVGTSAQPVAGLPLTLKWQTKNVLKDSQGSVVLFLTGDGKIKSVN